MSNDTNEPIIENQIQWQKQIKTLRGIIVMLVLLSLALEIGMIFVFNATGTMDDTLTEYFRLYVVKPLINNLIIVLIGVIVSVMTSKNRIKENAHLLVVTLLIGNIANIHDIFMVLLFLFMVPIFMAVAFQNRSTLNMVTILSELLVIMIAGKCLYKGIGASRDGYYIPSVILIMVLLLAARYVARVLIDILNEKTDALTHATAEAQEAKRRAEASNQSKTMFLTNMSHEIRTPINAVLGMDEMILRESSQTEIIEYARNIQSSGKALLALINDILDLSKIESGNMELIYVDYEIASVINDLVNMISSRVYDKGLSFLVEVDPGIPYVLYGDEIRLKQIVTNLLTNAVKYTEKGSVTMQVGYHKRDEKSIVLSVAVKDTGRGMKKEDMDKLFAPFKRIEEEQNRNIEGTGLGLSITKQLLSLMNSELKVESVYGEGSTFSFEIVQEVKGWDEIGDYTKAYKNTQKENKRYQQLFTAKDARVLVVDDVSMNLKVFAGLLKKTQIQIDSALSGEEGLELAAKNKYDVIFIDHMMPGMDGIEMLTRLEEAEYELNADVPKVALTANAISGAREFYINEGFTEYLTKPIDVRKLEGMIAKLLPEDKIEWT
ncbi:MAG: ATP-binding protein [Lachnospiraceae bacterium]|nr:ATP-binding protein [Lachnospiraceae bacterium]